MCANFQTKWTTLKSLAQVCPEMDLGLEIEKRVNQNPRDTLCANFQSIWRTLAFLVQICPEMNFEVGISKI